jgi:hypothetical protein
MKKSPKKLTLTRETLRDLETSQLAKADGGALPGTSSGTFSYTRVLEDCCVGCTR